MVRGANEHVFPGENLQGVKYKHVRLTNPKKLAYSPVSYGPSYRPMHPPYYDGKDLWSDKLGCVPPRLTTNIRT